MKLKDIPEEEPRVDLATLPEKNTLQLIDVEERLPKEGKTGGKLFIFKDKEGKQFKMKYSKVPGTVLKEAMRKLGYDDTNALKVWHEYKMVPMRIGYPRYIPVKKC